MPLQPNQLLDDATIALGKSTSDGGRQSTAAPAAGTRRGPGLPLHALVRGALDATGRSDWTLADEDFWCHVGPRVQRVQGWKLHLSATPLSAPHVLFRAATVLATHGCPFKFAGTADRVEELTGTRYNRAQAGKFITVYPDDDEQFRSLGAELDTATAGLPGPQILSDRPWRPGSIVHYRFGAFTGVHTLTNDGSFEARIQAPDGSTMEDVRQPWFCPPAWAVPPVEQVTPGRPAGAGDAKPVLLNDRFMVRTAIAHSARGGVYRALDEHTGNQVVIKQARPHIGARYSGQDGRDVLRAEHDRLTELAGLGPEPVSLFEKDGHVFLAEEAIDGVPMTEWATSRVHTPAGLPVATALRIARQLVELLAEVHRRGLVFLDFSSNNVLVTEDETLRLIDPELTARPGEWINRGYTPGFAGPELVTGPSHRQAPGPSADLYALGGMFFLLATGCGPAFPEDRGNATERGHHERLADMLAAVDSPVGRALAPAIHGLTAPEPERRWSLARCTEFLAAAAPGVPLGAVTDRAADRAADWDRLIDDGLAHLVSTMDTSGPRLWPARGFGATTDPCSVQHGAAGVLAVLTRASAVLDRPPLRDAVATAARWLDKRRIPPEKTLPGLYFGRAGTAWALHAAAEHLGDDTMAEHAMDLAMRLPVRWPNPDVCHGAAGAGITQLRFFHATGQQRFLDRVHECADGLLAAAEHTDDGVFWPIPKDFDSKLAGLWHFGFAHGVAGVGAFLLAAGQATGREELITLASAAGDTLLAASDVDDTDGGATWRSDRIGERRGGMMFHWCSGSSGVGTFLVRLAAAVEDGTAYRDMARRAGVAVWRARWAASPAVCHGNAGNGEFLLDLADHGDAEQLDRAGDLAACMNARNVLIDGRRLLTDETQLTVTADYNTGLAGAIGFLLRLRHGGPRPWMADGTR